MSGLKQEINWMIGGPQGTGVDSSATLFARAMTVAGFWVFGKREYHSNIKGKHSYFQIRAKHEPVHSNVDPIDILATFDKETPETHADEIVPTGALIYDPKITDPGQLKGLHADVLRFPIDYDEILKEMAEETGKNPLKLVIMKNTISVAASLALYGVDIQYVEQALKGLFTESKAALVDSNMLAAKKAYAAVQKLPSFAQFAHKMEKNPTPPAEGSRLLMNGATAAGMGKLKAGCRFLTYYSITPAVDECIFMEGQPDYGIVVTQCEDELAAVNMMNGAGTTGIRASTATSGPGFSLMAEGIGWAGINEVPAVIFAWQRGGPSTGLPTRSEQADLMFALNIGHGELPHIVIAPGDMEECFEDGFYSFNYADRYQTPVIVMPDKALANGTESITAFNEEGMFIDRGEIVASPVKGDSTKASPEETLAIYPRFKVTESGISPRPLPGTAGTIYWMTGDEHTEVGHITEDPAIRVAMHEKRFRKVERALDEIPVDRQYKLYGDPNADITLVGWGSTKGAVLDAIKVLQKQHDIKANYLHVRMFAPFPKEGIMRILKNAKQLLSIESNFTGQLCELITQKTGIDIPFKARKYTGRPISETEVVDTVVDIVREKDRSVEKRVVLTYGR